MAKYMYTFRKRLEKLIGQGFVIPSYIMRIKNEKTARKYTAAEIMKRSKFKEIYQGKERIVSGARGAEILKRESALKGYITRKRKEELNKIDLDLGVDFPWEGELPKPDSTKATWESRRDSLDARIKAIFDSFLSRKLANKLQWLFDKESKKNPKAFWEHLLGLESNVVSKLEEHSAITYYDSDRQVEAYRYWEMTLNFGEIPSIDELKDIAEDIDSNTDNSDMLI